MRVSTLRFGLGVAAIISGFFLNLYAMLPHYYALNYDRSVGYGMGPGINPGGPVLLAIPPINYFLLVIGTFLIIAGIILIVSNFTGRWKVPTGA